MADTDTVINPTQETKTSLLHKSVVFGFAVVLFFIMFSFQFFHTYVLALSHYWVALMSGLVSVLVTFWEKIHRELSKYMLYTVAGACVFLAGFQAWQEEHRNCLTVIAEKSAAVQLENFWKDQSYQKDADLRARDGLLTKNYSVLAETQLSLSNLSNRILDAAGPGPRKIDAIPWKIPGKYSDVKVGPIQLWALAVITNRDTQATGNLTCDGGDFTVIADSVVTDGSVQQTNASVVSSREYHVEFASPLMSPQHPLMFFIVAKPDVNLHNCAFKLG